MFENHRIDIFHLVVKTQPHKTAELEICKSFGSSLDLRKILITVIYFFILFF